MWPRESEAYAFKSRSNQAQYLPPQGASPVPYLKPARRDYVGRQLCHRAIFGSHYPYGTMPVPGHHSHATGQLCQRPFCLYVLGWGLSILKMGDPTHSLQSLVHIHLETGLFEFTSKRQLPTFTVVYFFVNNAHNIGGEFYLAFCEDDCLVAP